MAQTYSKFRYKTFIEDMAVLIHAQKISLSYQRLR